MLRPLIAAFCCAALPAPVFAQDKPISVYFQPSRDQRLNDAITAVLTQPPFILATKPVPGALVIAPGNLDIARGRVSGTTWTFDVAFSRDGSSRGQSVQSCNESKISDCTDQLVADVKSAAGMAP
jgi:hypothetical protein